MSDQENTAPSAPVAGSKAPSRQPSGAMSQSGRKTKTSATPVMLPALKTSAGVPESSRRHRCPHHPASQVNKASAPCTLSEYANRYIPHPIELRKSLKPEYKPTKGDGTVSDKTTQRVDYIKHPYERPWVRQADAYVQPEGDIDHYTNYKKDYTEKPISKTKPIKKDKTRKTPGKFEGDPTYKHDYRKWSAEPPKKIVRGDGYRPSSQPFDGNPTYTADYIRYNEPPRQSLKPAENAKGSDQPFDGETGYRVEYTKKQMPAREVREKPKWESNKAPLDDLSNYRKDYVPKGFEKTASCKPDANAYRSDQPLNDETTQRADYIKWPAERPFVHEPEAYVKPDGAVDYNTTHGINYDKKPLPKKEIRKPTQRKGVPGKFDGLPTYSEDYRKWPLGERPELKKRVEYRGPDGPFEGNPTYQADYIKYNEPPRQSLKPAEKARDSDQPFDGTTGYRQEYTKKQMPLREKKEKAQYVPNKAALDDLSNYRKDYVQKNAEKMPSCKPDNTAHGSDAPFHDETTQRFDFKKWPASRPFVHEPDQYRKPEGDIDFNTVHTIEYNKKPLGKAAIRKPAERKAVPGKFDGTTNYYNDFRKWESQPVQQKQKESYAPPDAPFEGSSNYRDDYIKHKMALTQSLKPAASGVQSDAPFEGGTEYKGEYTKKALPPCPAGVIQQGGQAGFTFREQDPSGHKWYEPNASVVDLKPPGVDITRQMTALTVA